MCNTEAPREREKEGGGALRHTEYPQRKRGGVVAGTDIHTHTKNT